MDKNKLNPFFQQLEVDYLYHLGLDSNMDLQRMFGDVKYVIFTQSFNDADLIANEFVKKFYKIENIELSCEPIGKNERYHIHKVHNSIIISHGIGAPSLLICLNEIVKLLWHSKVETPKFFRTGPAGGLGVAPGSIVIGTKAVDNSLKAEFSNIEFGQMYTYPTCLDADFSQNVLNFSVKYQPVTGQIIGGMGFYSGQARLNGAMPLGYSQEEQKAYLHKVYDHGVRSFDMEALGFAAFCHQLSIPCCEINSILIDRFEGDQISMSNEEQQVLLKKTANLIIDYVIAHA